MRSRIGYSVDVVLFIILLSVAMRSCRAEAVEPACNVALSACEAIVAAQDKQVQDLRDVVRRYEAAVQSPSSSVLGFAAAALTGAAGGATGAAVAGGSTSSVAAGVVVGAGVAVIVRSIMSPP